MSQRTAPTGSRAGRLVAWLTMVAACLLLGVSPAMAQDDFDFTDDGGGGEESEGDDGGDFDFTDEGGDDGGGDFDFTDEGDGGETGTVDIEMPDGSKPIIVAWFEPSPDADSRVVDRLTDALVKHLGEFEDHDVVNGIVMRQDLDALPADERDACVYDPVCLSERGKELGVQKIVVGRITADPSKPDALRISLDLIDVESGAAQNFIDFEAAQTVRGQERELRPAAYRLFDRKIPVKDDGTGGAQGLGPKEDEGIATWQLATAISLGVAGLGLVGGGIAVGLQASDLETEIMDGKKDGSLTQVQARDKFNDADDKSVISNVLYATGGVAIAAGVIILLVDPGSEIAEDQNVDAVDFYVNPTVSAEGAGMVTGFSF